ncbi:EAL domain-containing protein [Agrobacterium rubi]|nr:EAL domain-containing protein [Agrobacterium rubi]NTF24828.1 EAL domain-containing protein [Agrobacterium rubi]
MTSRTEAQVPLPFEVRKEMIRTLFGRPDVIILGVFAHVTCMLVAYFDTSDWHYLVWIPLFVTVASVRMAHIRRFEQSAPSLTSMDGLDVWERSYIMLGSGTTLLVGLVATYAAFADPQSLTGTIGQGMVGGTMIAIVGRNFGSIRNVRVMSYTCCVPVALGYFLAGFYHGELLISVAALPVIVIILTGLGTATNLHQLLLSTLLTKRQSDIVSRKFEAAIASMPNGLVLVDGNQRMIVINKKANQILGGHLREGGYLRDALASALVVPDHLMDMLSDTVMVGIGQADYQTKDGRWLRFGTGRLDEDATYLDDEWGGQQEGAYILTILDVTKKVEDQRKLVHLARYDGLTGLANRRWWEEYGSDMVDGLPVGSLVAMAVLDIDRFKLINDTLGHHVGDRVLQGVASRIRATGDARAFPGRLGGDEFVVLLAAPTGIDDARDYFDRLFANVCATYQIEGHSVEVACSGGVVLCSRQDFNIDNDLSRADMALYKVKRTGQSWMLFDDHLEAEYQSSVRIKNDLRNAIENQQLQVVYQPIYDSKGERMMSAEALCRWDHETAGHIPPSQFIAMAEEIGVIGQLTEYVLRQACADCMTWNSDVTVAVNLSALDLARDGIVDVIAGVLQDAGMQPERLCIEVTEGVFVKDFDKTAATLLRLREMGIKTSLDDFGTGYSSLSYMHRLPLNRVKIDKSFVETIEHDAKTQQLFKAVVGLAKGLGFEVVVEGVENRQQLALVVSVPGVDMIQGHIFSRGLTNVDMAPRGNVRRQAFEGKIVSLARDMSGSRTYAGKDPRRSDLA